MGMARLFKATLGRLARILPDVPRWVETRSMLHSCRYEVFGLEEGGDPGFVVRDTEDVLISVAGRRLPVRSRTPSSESGARTSLSLNSKTTPT